MCMASEMALPYHFKDSEICPTFTSFCVHFFFSLYMKFFIDAVLDHRNVCSFLPDKPVIYCKESNIY